MNFNELFSAFDYIDEIIYICDMETYALVYCNRKLREMMQVTSPDLPLDGKCYQVLQHLDHPCVFCNNEELKKNHRCIWTRRNPHVDKYYLLHDSLITIGGKDYRMELAVDATHLEDAAAHTRQMLEMETHLTDCVRHLVKSGNFSNSVSAVLQTVLNFYSGERAYLFEFDWDRRTACNTYEICVPGIAPEIDNLQEVPMDIMQFWIDLFAKQSAVVIEDLSALKDIPERQGEYEALSVQGIRSIIAVPIFTEDQLTSFIGVDNPSANFGNSDFLVNLAYFIGTEINKNQVVRELRDTSCRDPLTGVYNRKGFEQLLEAREGSFGSIGFAMVDVDNFKMINDTYGHDVGDEILREAASLLTSSFRSDDIVFRLGGDEFAVLLSNCSAAAWNTICSKFQWIHTAMAERHPEQAATMSVGICFTPQPYSEAIYRLADNALYETKRDGRAGCTMINEATGERKHWKDDTLSSLSRTVLAFNSTGLFRVEYLPGLPPRMYCNDIAHQIFDLSPDTSPEECYRIWWDGVDDDYRDALAETRELLLSGVSAECTYLWNHPEFGRIHVRSIGTGEKTDGVQILYGYHHSLKDTKIVEREDESKLLLVAISSIYFGSYYIDLNADSYFTIKNAPNERLLHVNQKSAADSLRSFVSGLVHTDDQKKMGAFVDLTTLPRRLARTTHVDCEYFSVVQHAWCRATFIPVKRDSDGRLTHVLFAVLPLDTEKAEESQQNARNKKTVDTFFNYVPGGLVTYEWNGTRLKTLQMSRYYSEQFAHSMECGGEPDYSRIHPDDLPGYRQAYLKALNETHRLEYIYRVRNRVTDKYVWAKINAVSEPQPDGTSLVYAMYSDVTGQKEAELRLQKKQASLVAALVASNQLCYEYDPSTHVEECLTEDPIFHLPRMIKNYPESVLDIVHPDDREKFLATIHSMDSGRGSAGCDIRLMRDGAYVWYSYRLKSFYDSEQERIIVIVSIMDNSGHISTVQSYQAQMQMLMGITEDALSFGTMNVTANTFSVIHALDGTRSITDRVNTLDELFRHTVRQVVGKEHQAAYRALFSRNSLLRRVEQGQTHVSLDHPYWIAPNHIEWVRTCADLLKNPSTGDVEGVCYSKSIQDSKITELLLERTLRQDYPLAAVVELDSGDYYLYRAEQKQYCVHLTDFWSSIPRHLASVMDEPSAQQLSRPLSRDAILRQLEKKQKGYSYFFDCISDGKSCRMEAKFNYLDDSRQLLLATLRDITDSVIMHRLRHDNERDHLTNLYNRRKTFAECRRLLEEHPEDQFAMLHFDIRHFRLYNTFFGDSAGDRLLCDIANMFRAMTSDYDYWAYGRIQSDVFCVFFPINQNKYQKHLHDLLHVLQGYRSDFLIEPAIGIYIVTDRAMSIESMFTRASIAAKTVRSGVTNAVVFYNEEMEQAMTDEQQVVNEMQTAIEQEQFQVYLQPKYSLRYDCPVGAEALVRWVHPKKGLISPAKFIPVFERNGFIATLDRYMWEHTCRLLRSWQDMGRTPAPVSVNVSRISMYNPTTVQFLKELVQRYGISPRYLELELTESAYVDDPEEMKKQLRELQDFGFHILMDDFGSGYSSLNTLRELPVDCLKLDMKFLSESTTDERGRLVLASVVRMSKLLHLSIIAEGVETTEQAEFLRDLGCEYAQGYLYAKPMPVEDYERLIVNASAAPAESPADSQTCQLLAAADTRPWLMEDSFPAPVALLEYADRRFTYLRANALFLSEFQLKRSCAPLSEIVRAHLSEADFAALLSACETAAAKSTASVRIRWVFDDQTSRDYVGRVSFQETVQNASVLVIAFLSDGD